MGEAHLLSRLVRPEVQATSSTLHDSTWSKSTEHTGFVIVRGVERRRHSIVWVGKGALACRTDAITVCNSSQAKRDGAGIAKDVAGWVVNPRAYMCREKESNLQVVTTARSVNCLRHFKELQRSTKSMMLFKVASSKTLERYYMMEKGASKEERRQKLGKSVSELL